MPKSDGVPVAKIRPLTRGRKILCMQWFVTDDRKQEYAEGMRANRLEANVMLVRRKAIWAGRNPDVAERYYRAKVEANRAQHAAERSQ